MMKIGRFMKLCFCGFATGALLQTSRNLMAYYDCDQKIVTLTGYGVIPLLAVLAVIAVNELQRLVFMDDDSEEGS
jgi:hypothetical protein